MSLPMGTSPSTRVISSFSSRVTIPRSSCVPTDDGAAGDHQPAEARYTLFRQVTKLNRMSLSPHGRVQFHRR